MELIALTSQLRDCGHTWMCLPALISSVGLSKHCWFGIMAFYGQSVLCGKLLRLVSLPEFTSGIVVTHEFL